MVRYQLPLSGPEFSVDQQFQLSWTQLFEEVEEAKALGHTIKPVLIGPLSYLWLGKLKGDADQTQAFDKLELLDRLLPVYGEVLTGWRRRESSGYRSTSRFWRWTCRRTGRMRSSAPTTCCSGRR